MMHNPRMTFPQDDAAAEAASADLLCCGLPQHQEPKTMRHYIPAGTPVHWSVPIRWYAVDVGDTVHRNGKTGMVTQVDRPNHRYLVEWQYPSFGMYWVEDQ